MQHHLKFGLLGLSATLVLAMMPLEASAKSRGASFGAVRSVGTFAERATRGKGEQTEPTTPITASPFAASATASAEPAPATVAAKVETLAGPNVGLVCIAGCYDARGQSVRR